MKEIININLFWYLCILIPFSFVIGIAITEIFVMITILFFFYKNRNLNCFKDKKFIFLFLFSIYILINTLVQTEYKDLRIPAFFHFRFCIFAISIFFVLNFFKEKIEFKKYAIILVFSFMAFIIFDAFIQYFLGQNIFGFEIIENRISGVFGDELILGSFLVRTFPLLLWIIFYHKLNIKRNENLLCIFFVLYFATIYISAGRTSFLLLLISIFFIIIFLKPLRKVTIVSSILLVLFITLSYFVKIGKSDPSNRIFIKTFNQIQTKLSIQKNLQKKQKKYNEYSITEKKTSNQFFIFTKDHTGHYILAYHLFKKSPFFGTGPEGFKSYCRKVKYDSDIGICSTHPHNTLMQILAETGFIGFLFYAIGLLFVFIKMFKFRNKFNHNSGIFCFLSCSIAIVINLFPFLPNGNFFNNWMLIISYYYIGLYLFEYNNLSRE